MDGAGLVTGLIGLPNEVLDLHERWETARDFDSRYRETLNAWDHSRLRLEDWISQSGFDGNKVQHDHHPRLDDF